MITIHAINEVFVHEALPVRAEPKQDRFGNILLFCSCTDDPLSLDDTGHESSIASNRLVERIVILLKVCLFHGSSLSV